MPSVCYTDAHTGSYRLIQMHKHIEGRIIILSVCTLYVTNMNKIGKNNIEKWLSDQLKLFTFSE